MMEQPNDDNRYYITILVDGRPIGIVPAFTERGKKQLNEWRGLGGYDTRKATIADKKQFRRDLTKKDLEYLEANETEQKQ